MEKNGRQSPKGLDSASRTQDSNPLANGRMSLIAPSAFRSEIRNLLASGRQSEVISLLDSSPNALADVQEMLHGKEADAVRQGAALVMVHHFLNNGNWAGIVNMLKCGRPETCSAGALALSKITGSVEIALPVMDALSEALLGGTTPEPAGSAALALAGAARNEKTREAATSVLGNALDSRHPEVVRLAAANALEGIAAEVDAANSIIPLGDAAGDRKSRQIRIASMKALVAAARNKTTSESALSVLAHGMEQARNSNVVVDYANAFLQAAESGISLLPVIGRIANILSSTRKPVEAKLIIIKTLIKFSKKGGDIFAAINILGRATTEKDAEISSKAIEAITLSAASAADPKTQQLAISTLGNLVGIRDWKGTSEKAAKALYDVIHATKDSKTKHFAVVALSNILSSRSHNRSKINALNTLAKLSEEGVNTSYAFDACGGVLMEGSRSLKKTSAWVLGNAALHQFDICSAASALTHALEKGDEELKLNAAWALRNAAKTGTRILAALPAIARILAGKRKQETLCNYCGEALWAAVLNSRSRTEGIHALGAALSSYDASWKAVWVAKNAVSSGIDILQAAEGLTFALSNKNVFIRQDAAETLSIMAEKGMMVPDSAKAALGKGREDSDPDTRFFSERALKRLAA